MAGFYGTHLCNDTKIPIPLLALFGRVCRGCRRCSGECDPLSVFGLDRCRIFVVTDLDGGWTILLVFRLDGLGFLDLDICSSSNVSYDHEYE